MGGYIYITNHEWLLLQEQAAVISKCGAGQADNHCTFQGKYRALS